MVDTVNKTLNTALETAFALLGRELPADADAVLTDIDVEEVSFVDRPANKRRFLIVKRGSIMKLTATAKEALVKALSEALEGLVTVSTTVKDAEESAEGLAALPKDELTKINSVCAALQKLAPSSSQPAAKDSAGHIDLAAMGDSELEAAFDEARKELGGLGSEFSDKMTVLAQAINRIAHVEDAVNLNAIRRAMVGTMKSAAALDKRVAETQVPMPERPPEDIGNVGSPLQDAVPAKDGGDALAPVLKSVAGTMETITARLEKLEQAPQAPASRTESFNAPRSDDPPDRPKGRSWVVNPSPF
jgi:hypothetical protein